MKDLPGEGWHKWPVQDFTTLHDRADPYTHRQIEIMRKEWDKPKVTSPFNLPRQMNAIGLYWREA